MHAPCRLDTPRIEPFSRLPVSQSAHDATTVGRSFDELDLPDVVREGIRGAGFTHCTPIQEKTLPLTLAGRDVAGQAQTGTGKTAAFLVTVFTRLLERERTGPANAPRALVIAPTRELAIQIADDARVLGHFTPFAIRVVYGGVDYHKQRTALENVDVLIGTPGRLIDYFKQRAYDLRHVEVLVVDEADRMFDMGFIKDLRYILRHLPGVDRRQSMLFSATLSYDVLELAYMFMNDAVQVSVSPEQVTAEKVEHLVYHVGVHEKLPFFLGLIRRHPDARMLVFVNMKRTAEDVEAFLAANGIAGQAITGDVDQRRRLKILEEFKSGTLPILVATDVASRGLHIEGVTHVVNYDIPFDAEDYVHRIGRTARAGASGVAYSLACENYVQGLEAIEEFIGFKLPHEFPTEEDLAVDYVKPPPRRRGRGAGGPGGRGPREGRAPRGRTAPREGRDSRGRGAPRGGGQRSGPPRPRSAGPHGHGTGAPSAPAAGPKPGGGRPRRRRRPRPPGSPRPAKT
jgi:ATP-dependent RNA helicase RhlB